MPDPVALARIIADELERARVPYAIGGAIALGYWAPPRGTADVDLNIFVSSDQTTDADRALRALAAAGVPVDQGPAMKHIERGEVVRSWVGRTAVDVFFDSIELHRSAAERAVTRPLLGRPAQILSAEDLIVLKLLFFRGKDVVDVEQIVASQVPTLERGYVRRWLVDCMGEEDERVLEWDRLVEACPEPK